MELANLTYLAANVCLDSLISMRGLSVVANATVERGTLGTICRVVNPGRSYQVRYADLPMCLLAFHDSLAPAPANSVGPVCESDC